MANISRLRATEISNGNVIDADDLDAEFDQLVDEANSKETRVTNLESGNVSIAGTKTFTGQINADTIGEATGGSGVTVDGVLIKDNFVGGAYLAGAGVNAQTGTTYTVLTGDRNKLVTFNNASAVAVTLPQAGSAGFADNYEFEVMNRGAGTVTITPTTSTIDGAATLTLAQFQSVRVYSDGTNYFSSRGRSDDPLLFSASGSSVSAVEVDTEVDWTKYHNYRITGYFLPVTDGADLYLRTSTDGGSAYDSGASDYDFSFDGSGGGNSSQIRVGFSSFTGGAANEGIAINLTLHRPMDSSYTMITGQAVGFFTSGALLESGVGGVRKSAEDVNGVQFLFSSGNISSYNIQVFGEGLI